jgi:uncharacterized phiE125 gp8 family phage protein
MVFEQGAVPLAALPMAEFRAHLRLGTGFAEDGVQDSLLESHLRAAIAAIEGRIGKVLLARRFLWELTAWRGAGAQALPVAPVLTVAEVALVDAGGQRTVLPAALWRLRRDAHRPCLEPVGLSFPAVSVGGRAEVVLDAGFGAAWGMVPPDLAQAVLLLAAEFYETRHEGGEAGVGLPAMVQALVARWRTVRVLGGGQA